MALRTALRWIGSSLLLWLAVCLTAAQGIIKSADCHETPAGFSANCGYVTLPQDYDEPNGGRVVDIFYTRIQSSSPQPQPDPLVYLVGGPGSSGSRLLLSSFRFYLQAFAVDRDIIVIDQRGAGFSNPPLYCREALFRLDEILQSRHQDHAELMLDILRQCHARLSQNGIRFDTFHSENNARDIVNVLLALGYERWNLVGVSYGSRLALAMMRGYPQYIRAVILDSVYPPQADIFLDAYYNGERALKVLFDACLASESCHARYPDLENVFYALYHRLNAAPIIARYAPPQYPTLDIEISGYRLYDWVFSWLYSVNSIQSIPRWIYELEHGRPQDAARMGANYEAQLTSLSLGMHYTVQCQEEYISPGGRDYAAIIAAHPHLSGYLRYAVEGVGTVQRLCGLWQAEARPAIANSPVESDIPTLLLSGDFDPITPPPYADLAAQTLSTSYSFVWPQVGHGVLRSDACAVDIALDFIKAPTVKPDSGCIDKAPAIVFD